MATYTEHTLDLAGGNVATLVHLPAPDPVGRAVLYVHGFVDYFFQDHLAAFFTDRGYHFYALDLRRYGRSLREGDIPWFTTDLAEYDEELDRAIGHIRADGQASIIGMAHSTGGLVMPLWLDRRRNPHPLDGLVLNSPWLDLQGSSFDRTVGTFLVDLAGRIRPTMRIPKKLSDVYPASAHKDRHGEWVFNTAWKPLAPVPALAGWLRAIRHGHKRVHQGLGLDLPILVMRSDESRLDLKEWSPEAMTADTVLDVGHIQRWGPALGNNVEIVTIPDGMHDLTLSAEPVRERVFAEMHRWLRERGLAR